MPSVTHDGRSFMLDGRRIWLAAGEIHYARLTRPAWADHIHAAKLAGLNTVVTPVFWNRHEPRPGSFDFTGDNDLRAFVELVGKAGMHCVLKLGPFIDAEWDLGGLPAWLLQMPNVALRTANQVFLEACSRYITAVSDQVRSLQVTAPGQGGPILMLQCETAWTCGKEDLAQSYLGELLRYFREAGLNVPVINSNNLWQSIEGQIDGWSGTGQMLATMRQLATVRPTQPRIVIEFPIGSTAIWGREPEPAMSTPALVRRMAEILAGGGQFNVTPFSGGRNFGFWPGRLPESLDLFATSEFGKDAAVTETAKPAASHAAVRRIAHLASRFGRVFANLDPSFQPIAIDPESFGDDAAGAAGGGSSKKSKSANGNGRISIVNASGSQGSVAFLFADPAAGHAQTTLLLPDGSTLPVTIGDQGVAWCLFDVHLGGRANLDYSNLNAFATLGSVFIAYGPAGARGMISINGSPLDVEVPGGKTPLAVEHEGLTIVIANEEQIDSIFVADDAVYLGVSGVSPKGEVSTPAGTRQYSRITPDGKIHALTDNSRTSHAGRKVKQGDWETATAEDYQNGVSARYASVTGPADLALLGCPHGYGWYRITLTGTAGRKKVMAPMSGDRLQFFMDGDSIGTMGVGPGAGAELTLPLKKAAQQLVILADNMGRFCGGINLGEKKGLFGDLYEVSPLKLAKPKVQAGDPIDLLNFRKPLWEMSEGDTTSPDRLTWQFMHRRKTPLIVSIATPPAHGILILNDEPLTAFDRSGPDRIVLTSEQLRQGKNVLQIALVSDVHEQADMDRLGDALTIHEAVNSLTEKSEMAFAKWEPPTASQFAAPAKSVPAGPRWWRCTFSGGEAPDATVVFEPVGMTKGEVFLNGRHLARYFTATPDGKKVPPTERIILPNAWLNSSGENTLMIFDEHGANPGKTKLDVE